jgi:hypothetical protein
MFGHVAQYDETQIEKTERHIRDTGARQIYSAQVKVLDDARAHCIECSGHEQSLARGDLLAKCQSARSGRGVHKVFFNR